MDSEHQRNLATFSRRYYAWLVEFLDDQDPVGIVFPGAFKGPEYTPEAKEMIALVPLASSVDDLAEKVHAIFVRMFDAKLAGEPCNYLAIANEMLDKWHAMQTELGLDA